MSLFKLFSKPQKENQKKTDPIFDEIQREVYGQDGLREKDKWGRWAGRNMAGIEHEKAGRTDEAIAAYEENVREHADTPHSYTRLAIIYRSKKQYDEEINVLLKALRRFPGSEDFTKRLKKARNLKIKSVREAPKG